MYNTLLQNVLIQYIFIWNWNEDDASFPDHCLILFANFGSYGYVCIYGMVILFKEKNRFELYDSRFWIRKNEQERREKENENSKQQQQHFDFFSLDFFFWCFINSFWLEIFLFLRKLRQQTRR